MSILTNILISVIASLVGIVGLTNVPLKYLEFTQPAQNFGSTITTINGSDTLSSSRSVINTNFSNLNTDKMELSTWYATTSAAQLVTLNGLTTATALASIGTITSGTWSGTAIVVAKGGTGTTSPTSNQIMIGNGSSGFKVIGFGTTQQTLTSNGDATAPSWQSAIIDQTQDYNFTGTTRIKTLIASSTISINNGGTGVSYVFPTSQGGVDTLLKNNGSGTLSWGMPAQYSLIKLTDLTTTGGYATSTLLSIPASIMTASSTIEIHATCECSSNNGACVIKIVDANGSP